MKRIGGKFPALLLAISLALFPSCKNSGGDDDGGDVTAKTESDWLFLFYFDGDNNLNPSLWIDMTSAQVALSTMCTADGSAAAGFPSVQMVALWDGAAEGVNATPPHPEAALYELGAMTDAEITTFNGFINTLDETGLYECLDTWLVSAATKDVTATASSWLSHEPDMNDVRTLTNFLQWAASRYTAGKIVLCLGDHGAGVEAETVSGGFPNARSLCVDDTTGTKMVVLTASDIKNAIRASGLSIDILWMDCCLQGGAENAYLLRGAARYLESSANTSYSHDYTTLFPRLTKDMSVEDFGKLMVQEYSETNGDYSLWDPEDYASVLAVENTYNVIMTNALYSLDTAKNDALYAAVSTLAEKILVLDAETQKQIFTDYVKFHAANLALAYLFGYFDLDDENSTGSNGIVFNGTYNFLMDIGYFCSLLTGAETAQHREPDTDLKSTFTTVTTVSVGDDVKAAAQTVLDALSGIIVASWGGKKEAADEAQIYPTTYAKNISVEGTPVLKDGWYGLTIVSEAYGNNFDLSEYAQACGYSAKWGELICAWKAAEESE